MKTKSCVSSFIILATAATRSVSSSDHLSTSMLASSPPMGWRSWNLFGPNVDQTLMENIMTGVAQKKREDHTGALSSLCDLGYCDVGLDDNWQLCKAPEAAPEMHYHGVDGKSIVNITRFPDMRNMTALGHSLGLKVGWYHNNCICRDKCRNETECSFQIEQDVQSLVDFGFDSVKLDGCGGQLNLATWAGYMEKLSPKPVTVENCHWGLTVPQSPDEHCDYHFYRTSGDIRPNYGSVMHNLFTVEHFHKRRLSGPGCWAYPDMLQVGVGQNYDGENGLNELETRSHFGAWAIVSSPLVLSHDVNDDSMTDSIWDLISNREVIAVNQAYVGDSGGVYHVSSEMVRLNDIYGWQVFPGKDDVPDMVAVNVPAYQFLAKNLGDGRVAVLLMNSANQTTDLSLRLKDVPSAHCRQGCFVRNIWNHTDLGMFVDEWTVEVKPHDAAFVILTAAVAPSTNVFSRLQGSPIALMAAIVVTCVAAVALFIGLRWREEPSGDTGYSHTKSEEVSLKVHSTKLS